MSSIWDEESLLHCQNKGNPPGGQCGDDPSESSNFIPNCWCGGAAGDNFPSARLSGGAPILDLDHGHFQMEFWFLPYVTEVPAWGATGYRTLLGCPETGNWPTDVDLAVGVYFDDTPQMVFRGDNVQWGGAANITQAHAYAPGWHHYAIEYDSGDQVYIYVDGILTYSVGAWTREVSGNLDFIPLIGSGGVAATYDEWHAAAGYAFPHIHGRLGPIAVYERDTLDIGGGVAGSPEIAQSVQNRYVFSPGDAVVCYDWGRSEAIQGRDCWETDRSRIIRGVSDLPEIDIACPIGTDGAVFVPDISGNAQHLILRTRTEYNAADTNANWATAGMACCALGSDPFFQQGGS